MECLIDGDDLAVPSGGHVRNLIYIDGCGVIDPLQLAAPFGGGARPCPVDQHSRHNLGRNREEVGAIAPVYIAGIYQSQVGFVDQGRSLKRVAGTLPTHVTACDAPELI